MADDDVLIGDVLEADVSASVVVGSLDELDPELRDGVEALR